jgi:hypothetical protein
MANMAEVNFVRQQGLGDGDSRDCGCRYPALMFQPRITAVVVAIGLVFQAWPIFLALSIVAWWNVVLPGLNPFDGLYNRLIAGPKGLPLLGPAPAPRRFAQGMAGTFMLAVGVLIYLGQQTAAFVVEAFLVVALLSLLLGRFCMGSYIFHLIRGNVAFANRTLPWSRP